jgi:hypothetical protein
MGVISPARPDLAAHREAASAPFARLVQELVAIIGKKLDAYIADVKDVRALDRWMDGAAPYKSGCGLPSAWQKPWRTTIALP